MGAAVTRSVEVCAYKLAAIQPGYAAVLVEGVPVGHVEYRQFYAEPTETGWYGFANSKRVGPICTSRGSAASLVAQASRFARGVYA